MNISKIKSPIKVFVIWDDCFSEGINYANIVYSTISRPIDSPSTQGISIPVEFLTNKSLFDKVNFASSSLGVIFILVDDYFVSNNEFWNKNIKMINKFRDEILIIPINIDSNPYKLLTSLSNINYVNLTKTNKIEYFTFTIIYEISRGLNRLLGIKDDIKLFLSHSKQTGDNIVKRVKNDIENNTKLATFYDRHDIPHGDRFDLVIQDSIKDSIVIGFLTDGYSSREWCVKELIIAKESGCPIILLDFYEEGEVRLFPYLGNVRIIRVNSERIRHYKILSSILLENIRVQYHLLHTKYLLKLLRIKSKKYVVMSTYPELLTVTNQEDSNITFIYPEPPLIDDELRIIQRLNRTNKYVTPLLFNMEDKYGGNTISGMKIGISISYQSKSISLTDQLNLENLLILITRYLLVCDTRIFYAGNPKYSDRHSFSNLMINIGEIIFKDIDIDKKNINLMLSEKVHGEISVKMMNRLKETSDILVYANEQEDLDVAETLTLIREQIANQTDAQVFLGGKSENYEGVMPGVLEEFYYALKKKNSIYILGGFGGVSEIIGKSLFKDAKSIKFLKEHLTDIGIDDLNLQSLNNGLNEEENLILLETRNPNVIVLLLLKGLSKKRNGG